MKIVSIRQPGHMCIQTHQITQTTNHQVTASIATLTKDSVGVTVFTKSGPAFSGTSVFNCIDGGY